MLTHLPESTQIGIRRYSAHQLLSEPMESKLTSLSRFRSIDLRLCIRLVKFTLKMLQDPVMMVRERHADHYSRNRFFSGRSFIENVGKITPTTEVKVTNCCVYPIRDLESRYQPLPQLFVDVVEDRCHLSLSPMPQTFTLIHGRSRVGPQQDYFGGECPRRRTGTFESVRPPELRLCITESLRPRRFRGTQNVEPSTSCDRWTPCPLVSCARYPVDLRYIDNTLRHLEGSVAPKNRLRPVGKPKDSNLTELCAYR